MRYFLQTVLGLKLAPVRVLIAAAIAVSMGLVAAPRRQPASITIDYPIDKSIFPPEITPPTFRMEARWTLEQLLGYLSTWSATNRFIKTTGRNPLEPLSSALSREWGDMNSPRLVVWPLWLRLGRK